MGGPGSGRKSGGTNKSNKATSKTVKEGAKLGVKTVTVKTKKHGSNKKLYVVN